MSNPAYPSAADAAPQRAQVWSRYWATGALHSCASSFGDAYGGAIGGWWQQIFGDLLADERVLDIATGSGALLQLGLRHCPSASVRWDGIDVGQVAPEWLRTLPEAQAQRVRVHPGIRAEALPFADSSFDLVTSQYGIEYSELHQSLAEVHRVLRPRGRLRCVLHHAQARSVVLARAELDHIRWLLAPDGLLQVLQQLCRPFAQSTTAAGREALVGDSGARALRRSFNTLQDQRLLLASGSACPDVLHEASAAIKRVLALAVEQGAPVAEQSALAFMEQLRDSAFRLGDLIEHALAPADIDGLRAGLRNLGFEVRAAELIDGAHLMGWSLQADLAT